MSEEEYIRNRLDQININSHYGLMIDTEINKLVCDHMKEKEDNKMKATSVQNIKNVKDVCFDISNDPIERESKLTIVASTNDDIFAFEFEGLDILQCCKRAGLFTGWEKDQKIRELEKENKKLEAKSKDISDDNALLLETNKKLREENEKLEEKIREKNREINDLHHKLHESGIENRRLEEELGRWKKEAANCLVLRDKEVAKNKERIDELKNELKLEKAINEAHHKFIKEYAGKGTEIEFGYAIDNTDEVSYVVVDKKTYDEKPNINLHGKDFTPDELVDRVLELEKENNRLKDTAQEGDYVCLGSIPCDANDIKKLKEQIKKLEVLKTPTIENFADGEPSDNVNHPSHYTGRYECIDVMQDVFGNEATDNFCLCNAFKYIWRARKKNGLEDVKKAVWYLTRYIEEAEKDGVRKGERV